jgi:hypothetical protein
MPLSVDTSRLRPPVADVVLAGALAALAQYEVWSGVRYQGAPVHPGPKLAVVPALAVATAAVAWRGGVRSASSRSRERRSPRRRRRSAPATAVRASSWSCW